MSFIKEPEGVDFIIESEPLTDRDRKEISKFISEYNQKSKRKTPRKREKAYNKH